MSTQTSLISPPTALIVTRRPGQEIPLRKALEEDSWFVKTCAGPGKAHCPLLRGEQCTLRESADAAVVFVDPTGSPGQLGALPRLRCAADPSSSGVLAMEGRLDAPRYSKTAATIGSLRGPQAILKTIRTLLVSPEDEKGGYLDR